MGNVLNQRVVAIEFEGRTVTGTYTVWSGMITVSTVGKEGNTGRRLGIAACP
jgi:hypothetical protein